MNNLKRHAILGGSVALIATAALSLPAIPQDPAYHLMADGRRLFGIPNGLDVVSNLAFLIVGAMGLGAIFSEPGRGAFRDRWVARAYAAVFGGAILTAFGSAYYHLAPDNARLVWDRLPMTIGFMGLLAAVLGERVNLRLAGIVFLPLMAIGIGSVVYWYVTELGGAGDLRLYGLVEFGALLVILLALALYPAHEPGTSRLVAGLLAYGAAKGLEVADAQVLALGHIVSGHTLKHLVAACAVGCLVSTIRLRTRSTRRILIETTSRGTSHPELITK